MELDGDRVAILITGTSLLNSKMPEKMVAGDVEHMVAHAYKRLIAERRKEVEGLLKKKLLLESFLNQSRLWDQFHRFLSFMGQDYNAT